MKINSQQYAIIGAITGGIFLSYFYLKNRSKNYLCIEIGGQSIVCSLINKQKNNSYIVLKTQKFSNTTPVQFLATINEFCKNEKFSQISIATFGPVKLEGPDTGRIYNKSADKKQSWNNINIVQMLKNNFSRKIVKIDTDVNSSALGHFKTGQFGQISSLAYITMGTGIGVGMVVNNKVIHGYQHPEGGHITINLNENQRNLKSGCLSHDFCVEAYSAAPFISKTLKIEMNKIQEYSENEIFEDVAQNVAQLLQRRQQQEVDQVKYQILQKKFRNILHNLIIII